jgi:hypothetical protein
MDAVTTVQAPPAFTLPAALVSQGFALRPETDADIPFLMRLYASTRADELAPIPWTDEQKQAFLAQQFQAQRLHYRNTIEGCVFDILEQRGEPAGRLYLDARQTQLHIVDIALMPDWRSLRRCRRPAARRAKASAFSSRSSIRRCGSTGGWASPTFPTTASIWRWNGCRPHDRRKVATGFRTRSCAIKTSP